MSIVLNGTTGITTPTYGGAVTAEYIAPVTSFKNRIINGAMQIDQRNAGASVTPTASTYTLDRWRLSVSVASKVSVQQNAGSVTPPIGFTNYLGVTSTSAYTVGASESFNIRQAIEGFNTADLQWGTANAATVTLLFWVRSSLTGTFGGSLYNSAANRAYPFSYTISSANTWEQKSVTIAGDTTGTWVGATNGTGLWLNFCLGAGSSASGTAGSWASTFYASATGATSVVGTSGATFYITGVQLEKGSTATSFDYRPYGAELALCQRYCVAFGGNGLYEPFGMGVETSSTGASVQLGLPVSMRGNMSFTATNIANLRISDGIAFTVVTAINLDQQGASQVMINANVASGLSAGRACRLISDNSLAPRLFLTSEL
jgi:hypothetical protein